MDQTIKSQEITSFYDELADYYDEMTSFDKRLDKERESLQRIVQEYRVRTAIDVGAGSGLHSIALAQLGTEVTGVDISARMIQVLQRNAEKYGVKIRTLVGELRALTTKRERYDGVFCLGNTIPHLHSRREIKQLFKQMHTLLAAKGILILQFLNYDKLYRTKDKIISVHRSNDHLFVRYYEYSKKMLLFNILRVEEHSTNPSYSLHSVLLYPWRLSEVIPLLNDVGFINVRCYSAMNGTLYDRNTSRDVVLFASRQ